MNVCQIAIYIRHYNFDVGKHFSIICLFILGWCILFRAGSDDLVTFLSRDPL